MTWKIEANPNISGINPYQLDVSASNAESKDVNRSVNVPDIVPSNKPIGLTANAISNGYIDLSWTQNTEKDIAGYKIYYGTSDTKLDDYECAMMTKNIFLFQQGSV